MQQVSALHKIILFNITSSVPYDTSRLQSGLHSDLTEEQKQHTAILLWTSLASPKPAWHPEIKYGS